MAEWKPQNLEFQSDDANAAAVASHQWQPERQKLAARSEVNRNVSFVGTTIPGNTLEASPVAIQAHSMACFATAKIWAVRNRRSTTFFAPPKNAARTRITNATKSMEGVASNFASHLLSNFWKQLAVAQRIHQIGKRLGRIGRWTGSTGTATTNLAMCAGPRQKNKQTIASAVGGGVRA